MSYKPNLNAHMPGASLAAAGGSVHSPSASMAASTQYRQLINDYGPPSLGYTQKKSGGILATLTEGEGGLWAPAAGYASAPLLERSPPRSGADHETPEEKQARVRERDRLKKRRKREDSLKRSLERQRNAEAMKRRREDEKEREKERRKDREAKRKRRQNVEERQKEREKDREAKKRRRREKKEEREKALSEDVAALMPLWDVEEEDDDEDDDDEEREGRDKEQTSVLLGTPASLLWGTGSSQVPQSKYAELLAIIEELGKEIRPTYAGSKSAMERLKRGIIHARGLVRECLAETERNARS